MGRLPGKVHGRDELVQRLLALVGKSATAPAATKVQVLCGLGGCGKTTVALELVRQAEALGLTSWWVNAAESGAFLGGLREVALQLGGHPTEVERAWSALQNRARPARTSAPDLLWRLLRDRSKPWLLVLDNADDKASFSLPSLHIQDGNGWIRLTRPGSLVLVTRRSSEKLTFGVNLADYHPLRGVEPDDGAKILSDLAGEAAGTFAQARELAKTLTYLPLALHLAGSYLRQVRESVSLSEPISTFSSYDAEVRRRLELLDEGAPGTTQPKPPWNEIITKTWEISLDLLANQGKPQSRKVLRLFAHLLDAEVPYVALLDADLLSRHPIIGTIDRDTLERIVTDLADLGLLELSPRRAGDRHVIPLLAVHRLVREVNRRRSVTDRQTHAFHGLLTDLLWHAASRCRVDEMDNWPIWAYLSPLALDRVVGEGGEPDLTAPTQTQPLLDTAAEAARFLSMSGRYHDASAAYEPVVVGYTKRLGPDHAHTLDARDHLGFVYSCQQRWDDAEREYRAVAEGRTRTLGRAAPDALRGWNNVAWSLSSAGKYAEAEKQHRTVLDLRASNPDVTPRDVLRSRAGAAFTLKARGELDEAADEYAEVVRQQESWFGADDPDTLASRAVLMEILYILGRSG